MCRLVESSLFAHDTMCHSLLSSDGLQKAQRNESIAAGTLAPSSKSACLVMYRNKPKCLKKSAKTSPVYVCHITTQLAHDVVRRNTDVISTSCARWVAVTILGQLTISVFRASTVYRLYFSHRYIKNGWMMDDLRFYVLFNNI